MTDTQTKVCLVSVTPDAERHMAYCARVSNPKNQDNESFEGLLKYCIKHQHWSIFEQAFMTLEITTSRGIAAQILRHRSFTFQEFSQRYADSSLLAEKIPVPELRRQDTKNSQNSIDDIDDYTTDKFQTLIANHFDHSMRLYQDMLEAGIAKECARFVLPLAVPTKIYMTGSVRFHGCIILICVVQMEHRKNIWILQTLQRLSSIVSSLLLVRQWDGVRNVIVQRTGTSNHVFV